MTVAALVRVVSSFLCCGTDEATAACNLLIKSPSQSMLRPVGYLMLRTIFQKDPWGYLKGKSVDVYPRDYLATCAQKCPRSSIYFSMELLRNIAEKGTVTCDTRSSDDDGASMLCGYGNGNAISITREVRALCCYLIGGIYLWGIGTAQNYNMAFKYFRVGSDSGCVWCENFLGLCYLHGWGVEKNPEMCVECMRDSMQKGNPCAASNLGDYYYTTKNDIPTCLPLFEAGAEAGNAMGILILAMLYRKGEGLPKDLYKAEKCMQLAASQGYPWAQNCLAVHYRSGAVESKGIQDALRLHFLAAVQDCGVAQYNMGLMHDLLHRIVAQARTWTRDRREATRWYRLAVSNDYGPAEILLKTIVHSDGE